MKSLAERIDAILPQTQCTKCGYPSCARYAQALAEGEADINQCPPGGAAGIRELAALLGRDVKPLNPANGVERPRRVAFIDEARCIGCTLCIQACPVDATGRRIMHMVDRAVLDATCACRPAPWIASRCFPRKATTSSGTRCGRTRRAGAERRARASSAA
jgi:electron transport complex protein RnfB